MKRLFLTVVIDGNIPLTSVHEVTTLLAPMGKVSVVESSQVRLKSPPERATEMWVYQSSDPDAPLCTVKFCGDENGIRLNSDDRLAILNEGVCVEAYAKVSRVDRYGLSDLSCNGQDGINAAMSFIGQEFNFSVPPEGFVFNWEDSGDDTPQRLWMKIKMPG